MIRYQVENRKIHFIENGMYSKIVRDLNYHHVSTYRQILTRTCATYMILIDCLDLTTT